MGTDAVVESDGIVDSEVMASVENGSVDRLVIADIGREDAYMTIDLADAATLPAWR